MNKNSQLIKILKRGGIGVLPTDTLYGLVGQAQNPEAVKKIEKLKKRSKGKPFIILISSIKDLEKFKIKLNKETKTILEKVWPGPVSVAFSKKIALRFPKNKFLNELIKKTGPLVAPSANPEGLPPAETTTEIKNYFGDQIDFIVSAGKRLKSQPSTLISIKNNKIEILRYGKYKLRGL
jgi:L-threonylcarbamoyladenylate synthase